jgi:hypothetical protein
MSTNEDGRTPEQQAQAEDTARRGRHLVRRIARTVREHAAANSIEGQEPLAATPGHEETSPRRQRRTKEQLLADYAQNDAQIFLQIDGFHGIGPDAVFTPDEDGDTIFSGVREDLRASPAQLVVRVQIHADADRADVVRLWAKLGETLADALDYLEAQRRDDFQELPD